MLNQKELALEVCEIGYKKVTKKSSITFLSAILAGAFIALGYYGYLSVVSKDMATGSFFFGSAIFTVGLVIILVAGGELFTGNCLVTMGYFNKQYRLGLVIKNLLLVYIGNFVGAIIIVLLIYFSGMVKNVEPLLTIYTAAKTDLPIMEALLRGILCNILVGMGVYLSYVSKSTAGKIIAAMLPTILFVVSSFEHSVANMFILFLGKANGFDVSISAILLGNLLPVTIGNFIGGGVLVTGAYYLIHLRNA